MESGKGISVINVRKSAIFYIMKAGDMTNCIRVRIRK